MTSVRHFGLIYVVVLKQLSSKFAFPLLVTFILAENLSWAKRESAEQRSPDVLCLLPTSEAFWPVVAEQARKQGVVPGEDGDSAPQENAHKREQDNRLTWALRMRS